ncbi:hypothetical protein [Saccharothrix deserti]|nr:hypothetical protein [Saccharothrix deserti]
MGLLASTGTVRAVVLIVSLGLVTGSVPGMNLPAREPSTTAVTTSSTAR